MAELENGLPPQNVDLSGKDISNVTFKQVDANTLQDNSVSSVEYLLSSFNPLSEFNIYSVQVTTEKVGHNSIFYYK